MGSVRETIVVRKAEVNLTHDLRFLLSSVLQLCSYECRRCESTLNLTTFLRVLQLSRIESIRLNLIDQLGVFLSAKV